MHIHTQPFHFDRSYTAHFLNVPVVAEAVSAKHQTVADWFELVLQFCLVQINVEHEAFMYTCFKQSKHNLRCWLQIRSSNTHIVTVGVWWPAASTQSIRMRWRSRVLTTWEWHSTSYTLIVPLTWVTFLSHHNQHKCTRESSYSTSRGQCGKYIQVVE